jgi:hypothetical protein
MRDEDKRAVIDVLLCTNATVGCSYTAVALGRSQAAAATAIDAWMSAMADTNEDYDGIALEAAYRLIESSPTLQREFFGSTAHVPVGGTER